MVGVVPVTAGAEETPVECVGSVDDPGVAVDVAAACGMEVEVASARTPWETVWATPAGGSRVELSAAAVRTDVNGAWEPIDTSLVDGSAGITVAAPALPITFSDGTPGMPLATIESDGHVLEFHAPFDLTIPSVSGDRVTYPQVLPGVDLIASVDEDGSGFSEVLRVESPEAAANPALSELEFPVVVSDGLTVSESEGGFVATDVAGEEVFSSPTPLMWDSGSRAAESGVTARATTLAVLEDQVDPLTGEAGGEPVEAPALDSVVAAMPAEVSADAVSITTDEAMIADPGTSWPIYIDPSVGRDPVEWTAIRSGMSSDWKFSGDQGLGLCDVSVSSSCGRDFKSRLVWEFHDLGAVANVAAGDITSATFRAYGTHSYNCTSYAVQAYRVENIGSGTTWSSNSGWTDARHQANRDVHHKSGCSSPPGWVTWNVMDAAKHVATNGGYLTIGLKDYYENSMTRWKRYRHDAKLSIEYNRAPAKPTSLDVVPAGGSAVACGSSAWMRDATPQLRAKITDPDGNRLYHNFNVYTSGGTLVYNGPWSGSSYASGTKVTRTVPSGEALSSGAYEFRVQAKDTGGRSGPSASCRFNVDVTPPATPTVSPVAGQPAVYKTGTETGGIGVVGKFDVASSSSDVTHLLYSWDDATAITTKVSGRSATITLDPRTAGPHTLRVKAIDRAGNASGVKSYVIDVAPPREDAAWELNEGDGAVGGDFLGRVDLTIGNAAMWTTGPFLDKRPDDSALLFDDASDTAATLGPVVRTDGSYVVGVHVRLDELGSHAVAVSQDATQRSGFKLGYMPASRCPSVDGDGCWAFSVPSSDGGALIEARSEFQVVAGKWVYLVGAYDGQKKTATVTVCNPKPSLAEPERMQSSTVAFTTPWFAAGPLQVGRGMHNGVHNDPWRGAIDNLRVWDGEVLDADGTKIWKVCTGAPMYSAVPGGDENDPTEQN